MMDGAPATILDHEVDLKMEAPCKANIWKKANDNGARTLVWEFPLLDFIYKKEI